MLDDDPRPVRAGDVIVLEKGAMHDLRHTGSEDLRAIAFFAAPEVEQHWTDEVWPGDLRVTRSPNARVGSDDDV